MGGDKSSAGPGLKINCFAAFGGLKIHNYPLLLSTKGPARRGPFCLTNLDNATNSVILVM